MRTFATQAWSNATLSVYPATVGLDQWIRLDNVTFQRTPATTIVGTECVEPGLSPWAPRPLTANAVQTTADGVRVVFTTDDDIDFRGAGAATLSFRSHLTSERSAGRVEVSLDGLTWETVALVPASEAWAWFDVDLSSFAGHRIAIRFVLDRVTPAPGEAQDVWLMDNVRIRIHR